VPVMDDSERSGQQSFQSHSTERGNGET
jgi:hypothetical protein